MTETTQAKLLDLTAQIVAAHAGHNQVEVDALPVMVRVVYGALTTIGVPATAPPPVQEPAVPVQHSVFPNFIVCLEDGKKLTLLKRYLFTKYGMTPDDYRLKWGLPPDYPMAAPNYADRRSAMAKSVGFGKGGRPKK